MSAISKSVWFNHHTGSHFIVIWQENRKTEYDRAVDSASLLKMSDYQPFYDMERLVQVGKWRNHTKKEVNIWIKKFMEFVIKKTIIEEVSENKD